MKVLHHEKPSDKLMLRVLSGERPESVPLWLMRQAGRYLPEYRALRAEAGSFLDLCYTPQWATEVTLQPLRRFDLDAAILFSDILVVPHGLGQDLRFAEGEGPRLGALPSWDIVKNTDDKDFLEKLSPVYETVSRVRAALDKDKTLIGFAGAPWTVACYMIQGHGDGKFQTVIDQACADIDGFSGFLDGLAFFTARHLLAQIRAGADVVQIFDSWAGLVPDAFFDAWVIAPTRKIVSLIHEIYPGFPVIGFPRQAGKNALTYAQKTGVHAVGLDQYARFGDFDADICLQGNLAPEILLAGGDAMVSAATRILDETAARPFIFNLGHGVIKETPPEHVALLVDTVKKYRKVRA